MTLPAVGDAIELVDMPEDPSPIEPGTRGVVSRVTGPHSLGAGPEFHQVTVVWTDSHRTLMLTIPPDVIRILGRKGDE